ncbi:lasso RiPP family leader peptide-containing protein [Nonomuraea sp. NPDC046570]|uniref:lasso RiPP family leader peptide-containing protein n=1 Tax=Nonomuraea sp. NPDC046570 TaxID=3155255 RepID=UPI0033F143CA
MAIDRSSRNDDGRAGVPLPYEPPEIIELGRIRDLVKGSSSSGSADANSQYYW